MPLVVKPIECAIEKTGLAESMLAAKSKALVLSYEVTADGAFKVGHAIVASLPRLRTGNVML